MNLLADYGFAMDAKGRFRQVSKFLIFPKWGRSCQTKCLVDDLPKSGYLLFDLNEVSAETFRVTRFLPCKICQIA